MMNKDRLIELYRRYQQQALTPEEREEWQTLLASPDLGEVLRETLDTDWQQLADEELIRMENKHSDQILGHILAQPQQQQAGLFSWSRIAVAASVLITLSAGIYFYQHRLTKETASQFVKNDIKPGSNGAILTLANGEKIVLEQTKVGQITRQNGSGLSKAADSLLVYQSGGKPDATTVSYNTLETPKGKQYTVVLPDGTKVMLNAASKLTYPTAFTGKERLVELSGEGWFKVVHNEKQPFKIKTAGQIVEDIGTEININAYTDEPTIKTTLVEGSIRVRLNPAANGTVLKPGQQSVVQNNALTVTDADMEQELAWKNGYFDFESENIQPIMRRIARWYDIEVSYTGNPPTDQFWGTVSRFSNVSQVLQKL
jgi:transmembrane sensor